MALLDFEQYPDYAMKTNKQGERVREPWASGPSPLSMALMAGGFGMMGDGTTEWVGGGGKVWDDLRRGGLLGVQAFGQGHRDLQGQRKDFYTQANALEDQLIQNQQAKRDQEEFTREKDLRKSMITGLPNLLETLQKTNIPGIQNRIPVLMAQAQSGDVKGAYQSATNLNSQLAKVTKGEPYVLDLGDGQKVVVQKDSAGGYHTGASLAKTTSGLGGWRGKAISLILKASQGKDGLTLESPEAIAAYEELKKPRVTNTFDPDSGKYFETEIPGYVPPSIEALMGGTSVGSGGTSSNQNATAIIKKQQILPQAQTQALSYGNRMQKAMFEMDDLMAGGYRPSRIVLEYVKMGAPQSKLGRAEKEIYRAQMSEDDRRFARAVQDWLRAKLRRESGAVIGIDEAAEEVEAFFNVLSPGAPSSSDDVYETFRNSRITALEGMLGEAGPAWQRWKDLGYSKQPRSSKYFYEKSPFQKRVLTKEQKIRARFKK
jgi:hypothetical protein